MDDNINIFHRFYIKFKSLVNKIINSKLYTFIFLLLIVISMTIFIMSYASYNNGILSMRSDDILQYYPYMSGFYDKLKSGTLSLYDKNLLIGASWFSGAYYVQIDIFTFFGFILSFFMNNYLAYTVSNFLHVGAGALMFYIFLARKFNNKAAFISSIVMLIGGIVEAYYIFPVYLGINFYAPLGMLLVDLVVEKGKKYYLFIPIYALIVVLFDFYIAYMLLAFFSFYFIVKCHESDKFSFFGKNTLFRNGKFWLLFLKFMGMVLLGVLISLFMLLPSALYILNESSRQASSTNESLLIFNKAPALGSEPSSLATKRHYFTQLINLYIPNEPHKFMLITTEDYVREHASLYITSGALIYLVYFFCLFGKRENRLKFWTIVINVMLLMPIFSIILALDSDPYVRWFFMPYMMNLYVACYAMDKNNFKIGVKYNFVKLIPLLFMILGAVLIIYTLKTNTEYFIHYDESDDLFKIILVPSLVFVFIYITILLTSFILGIKWKNIKFLDYFKYSIPFVIILESIFAGYIIYDNLEYASSYDYNALKEMKAQKEHLETLGYNESDGYRINIYSNYGRGFSNLDIALGVNFGRYFQSFYNTEINPLLLDFYGYNRENNYWNKIFNYGYNLTAAPIFNMKYVITPDNINLPSKYYSNEKYENVNYYTLKDNNPFIVYDNYFTDLNFQSVNNYYFYKQCALLNHCYIKKIDTEEERNQSRQNNEFYEAYKKVSNLGMELVSPSTIKAELDNYIKCAYVIRGDYKISSTYYVYDMTSPELKPLLDYDCINVYPNTWRDRTLSDGWMYYVIKSTDTNGDIKRSFYQGHYNEIFSDRIVDENGIKKEIHELWVQHNTKEPTDTYYHNNSTLYLCAFNYDLYDYYLNNQAKYQDKEFSLKGSEMKIKFKNDGMGAKIIKTAYAYSSDWKLNNDSYETILVDDAFLGIIVPSGVTDVDITLTFTPDGFSTGLMGLNLGLVIYMFITSTYIIFHNKKYILEETL